MHSLLKCFIFWLNLLVKGVFSPSQKRITALTLRREMMRVQSFLSFFFVAIFLAKYSS